MSTTQKIQAVLDTGLLGLPDGIGQAVELRKPVWTLNRSIITQQQAHDLIACHWAREMPHDLLTGDADKEFDRLMGGGLAEAAIRAIYEALCGGKQ